MTTKEFEKEIISIIKKYFRLSEDTIIDSLEIKLNTNKEPEIKISMKRVNHEE